MKKRTIKKNKRQKYDAIPIGLVPGLIMPVISFYIFYLIKNSSSMTFLEFVQYLNGSGVVPQSITLGVLPNLLVFFIFIWTNKYQSARGVLLATMIYTAAILIYKYFF